MEDVVDFQDFIYVGQLNIEIVSGTCSEASLERTISWYSFHINCAGKEVKVYGKNYEADEASEGFAKFVHEKENWGSSSSGYFGYFGYNGNLDEYYKNESQLTSTNISVLQVPTPELYVRARISPLSLTYYGRCLANGTYTVRIHFVEIMFIKNQTSKDPWKRRFDIYIQDEVVEKDFNIEEQAGGINKAVIKEYKASVKNSILQIRFRSNAQGILLYYSPKIRGNYASLVSAISVESGKDSNHFYDLTPCLVGGK
ncbi:hypothetical protein Leryth_021766 [Lithospermum erythrorhizon]|nr:hypothetical protein Leryth_021766 [Lithospermum erythrorhizon]